MYRVIIADDEDYIRNLLVKNIQNSSMEIEVAAAAGDGREALEQIIMLKPDIVITDISMPFMNGLELIKEIQTAGIHTKNVIISGYDEFDYARQAISLGVEDYLLKPFLPKEMNGVLQKLVEELERQKVLQQNVSFLRKQALNRAGAAREKVLKNLLEGREIPEIEKPDFGELGIELDGNYYLAGVIRLSGEAWDFRSQEGAEEFLTLIRDGYFPSNIRIYGVSFDGTQLAAIWCGGGEERDTFVEMVKVGIKKLKGSLKSYYQMQLTCALGRPYKEVDQLEQSYKEAMAVWRGMLDVDPPVLVYGYEQAKNDEATSSQIREWKNQLRFFVRTGQIGEALKQLQGLMKCYAALANKKNDYISASIGELVYAIQNDMEEAGYEKEKMEPSAMVQDRLHYGSLLDMREMLEEYIKQCCIVAAEYSEETNADLVVKQIQKLIDHNIQNMDMDLEWMAAHVHFSSSYVRQIFKQRVGEGLGEYVIRKRMELAGMLLQKTTLRVQEVAEECGYDNQRYFARSFKKFYGCTPTEFKRVVEKENLY